MIVHFLIIPLAVFTVITAVPGATAVILPLEFTLQTDGFELENFSLSVLLCGVMEGIRENVFPAISVRRELFSVSEVDGIISTCNV